MMEIYSVTDISKREENQDNYWCGILDVEGSEVGVLCVCDGMGGLDFGEKASRIVVEKIRNHVVCTGSLEGLGDVIVEANNTIKEVIASKRSGTTCTVLMCRDGRYLVYNIGDSRCYHWYTEKGKPYVYQITEDHTVLQRYKKEGKEITPQIASKYKNVLTRCIGVDKALYDCFEGEYSEGDSFLVCSDGFWHTLSEEDFFNGNIYNLREMIRKCQRLGEVDNITACLLKV